jgi:hypothetical protein
MPQRIINQPPIEATCKDDCPPQCEFVFDRVHVSYLIRGGARVMWDIVPEFSDPLPWTFQLQVGKTANNAADDWTDVGLPADNSFYAIDSAQHVFGRTQFTHYRVKLSTTIDTYYSQPTNGLGVLDRRDWRLATEAVRQERVRNRLESQVGYLLKRRSSGLRCTLCTEHQTAETLDPNCPQCFGTGFQCGYYYPMPCVYADIGPKATYTHLDPNRGTVNDIVVQARMLMVPLLESLDVWVSKKTDDRYYIHEIQSIAERKGIPLIANVKLRPAPYSDVIYDIEIPEQIAALEV